MSELGEPIPPPQEGTGSQEDWDNYLRAQGEGVFDPATKSAKETNINQFHPDEIPLDRAEAGEIADRQPDTPVQASERAERVKVVRETLASINPISAEALARRNTLTDDPDSDNVETYDSIAKTLPRGDGSGENGVNIARVQKRERNAKFRISQQIGRSGPAGHPLKDYERGIDKQ